MVDCVIDNEATGAARVKDGVVSIFSTRMIEVGGGKCSCVERGSENGFAFTICALMDYPIVDVEVADIFGDMWPVIRTYERKGVVTGVARVVTHPLATWVISIPHLSLRGGMSHSCWISGSTEKGRQGVVNRLVFFFLHIRVDDVSEDGDVTEV